MNYKSGISILVWVFLLSAFCVFAEDTAQGTADGKVDEQLQINKDALLKGSDEQIRVSAAGLLLESGQPQARKILLDSLCDVNNPAAQAAICKAFSAAGQKPIVNKADFAGPLLKYLGAAKDQQVQLAAEALLTFDYEQIEKPLMQVITNHSLPGQVRLNGIHALRLQRDIRAIIQLIELLGDTDEKIVAAAAEALNSLGIPAVGKDAATRRQMIEEIQRIGKDEFLRYWQMRQGYEKQISALKEQRNWWKQQYLAGLDEFYSSVGNDETAKARFLQVRLASAEPEVRLWALTKVRQWWVGTEPKSKLLAELGPALIKLISDENSDVRLNTARLVSLMGEIDSAQTLLKQIKLEKDDAVRTEQFIALGQACRYAFSVKSTIKLDAVVRKETLELAVQYLNSQQPAKAQKGAEVMRNLLEYDGLSDEEIAGYLGALVQRYAHNGESEALSGELLNSMAMLCGQSVYKLQAAKLFEKHFNDALGNETDLVREAAVNGLINIDKSAALKRLRRDFPNDKNANIRKSLIGLAQEVGSAEDLAWLVEKVNSDSEGPAVWKAMTEIFDDSPASLLNSWTAKLEQSKLADARMATFLETAYRKATAEQKADMAKNFQYKLAGLYTKTGDFAKAAEYLGNVLKDEKDAEKRKQFTAELASVYLAAGNLKAVVLLVHNRLLETDIDPQSPLAKAISDYLKTTGGTTQPKQLFDELSTLDITTAGERPKWRALIEQWSAIFVVAETPPPAQPQPAAPNDVNTPQ